MSCPVTILVLALCVWRLSSLVAEEDGPFYIFSRFRTLIGVVTVVGADGKRVHGTNVLSKGIICMWCNSVWFGILVAILYYKFPVVAFYASLPMALSAMAIVYEEVVLWLGHQRQR